MTGLYLHIPFCRQKCAYCDFVSASSTPERVELYLKLLEQEIRLYGQALSPAEKKLTTLFIGGGTPTYLSNQQLARLLELIQQNFNLTNCSEISLEANPGTVDLARLKALRQMGFNRLSLGVQSYQDELLQILGRIHNGKTALKALQEAQEAGFANLNADLIFGIPTQSLKQWEKCLQKLTELKLPHLSLYSLQIESGTPLAVQIAAGALKPCPEDQLADMDDLAEQLLKATGLERYEISNYARSGWECQHNLNYWRRVPYWGLGLAAHSLGRQKRFANPADFLAYQKLIQAGQLALENGQQLTSQEALSETFWLGLRMTQGLNLSLVRQEFNSLVQAYEPTIQSLIAKGLLQQKGAYLSLTPRGRELGNWVFAEFV